MYRLSTEDLRLLIQGKFSFAACLDCAGKGDVLVDGDEGVVVPAMHPEKDKSHYYTDACESCNGLGGTLKLGVSENN